MGVSDLGKEKDFSELLNIKEKFNKVAEKFAQEVLWAIENQYESVIDVFYADYNPLYYYRTYSTYLASSGYKQLYSPENYMSFDNYYNVGISIDSQKIPGNPYRADTDWVFNRTFEKGIHGINTRGAFGLRKPRLYRRYYGESFPSGKSTFSVVKMKNQDVISNIVYRKNVRRITNTVMENTVPAPKSLMNQWWRRYKTRKNLDSVYASIMNTEF